MTSTLTNPEFQYYWI